MEQKLCIDCKHFKSRSCEHPILGTSLVDGYPNSEYAAVMRLESRECKPAALLFEPMEAVIYDMADLFPNRKGATQ